MPTKTERHALTAEQVEALLEQTPPGWVRSRLIFTVGEDGAAEAHQFAESLAISYADADIPCMIGVVEAKEEDEGAEVWLALPEVAHRAVARTLYELQGTGKVLVYDAAAHMTPVVAEA